MAPKNNKQPTMEADTSMSVQPKTNIGATSTNLPVQSQRAVAILQRFPTMAHFDNVFSIVKHPDYYMPSNADRCHDGNAPTLYALNEAYGAAFRVWLVDLIAYIGLMSGTRDKLAAAQEIFVQNLFLDKGYIKVTELLLFVSRYIAGEYGQTYGSIDPQKIGVAFGTFLQERRDAITRIESNKRQQARATQDKGVTFEEYRRQMAEQGVNVPPLSLGGITKKI